MLYFTLRFSCKLSVPISLWDTKANKASGKSLEARRINEKLENIKTNIGKRYQRLCDRDPYVTAEKVRNAFLGMGDDCRLLLQIFDEYLAGFHKRVGKDRSVSTFENYSNARRYLTSFLKYEYNVEDVLFKELNRDFIEKFVVYLSSVRHMLPDSIVTPVKKLKLMALWRIRTAGFLLILLRVSMSSRNMANGVTFRPRSYRLRAKGADKPVACLGRAGSARAKRHDGFFRKIMCCEERADGRRSGLHPDGITDEYHVIRRDVFDIRCQRRAISGCHFFPDLCQQSIVIIGIGIDRLDFYKVALYRVMDISGNRPGIARMGEIDN